MNRIAQGLVLTLLGTAVGGSALSDLYLNYVKAPFRPALLLTAVVLVGLGLWVAVAGLRSGADAAADGECHAHGHDHSRAPAVAWLLVLPAVSVFVVAPPALGAYSASDTATTSAGEADDSSYEELGEDSGPVEMAIREFVVRAWTDESREMAGREIELTGFVTPKPDGEGWYLTRLQIACCAADAIVNRVLVVDEPAPAKDSWWRVRGMWEEPEGDLESVREHRFTVPQMTEVADPPDPYE